MRPPPGQKNEEWKIENVKWFVRGTVPQFYIVHCTFYIRKARTSQKPCRQGGGTRSRGVPKSKESKEQKIFITEI